MMLCQASNAHRILPWLDEPIRLQVGMVVVVVVVVVVVMGPCQQGWAT
jgi:hypothetical protein